MNIGDIVIPIPGLGVLRCGSGEYTHAICVSVEPFVLVSEEADMLWSATAKLDQFTPLCRANEKIVQRCIMRAWSDAKVGSWMPALGWGLNVVEVPPVACAVLDLERAVSALQNRVKLAAVAGSEAIQRRNQGIADIMAEAGANDEDAAFRITKALERAKAERDEIHREMNYL